MAGSGAGLTAGGAGAGTAACVVGVVVGAGAAAACVVVVTGVGKAAKATGGETFSVVAVTAPSIFLSCALPAAATAFTTVVAVGRGAEAPSDRAPPEVLMATAPEARAIATIPTAAPRPRRVRIGRMVQTARFRSDLRPAPEDVAEWGWCTLASTMC